MSVEQRQGRQADKRMIEARDRALAEARRRKEEYLGARVPRELREKVMCRARELGLPVSILIRNVLDEAFGGGSAALSQKNKGMFADVLGWEEITLNRAIECACCSTPLHPGTRVTLGLGGAKKHVVLCSKCKEFD